MKMMTISGDKSWSTLIDQFSRAVNDNDSKYHRLEYNTYRKLVKYNPIENIMNITRKNDGIITVVDPRTDEKSGYLLWSGSEIDNSFGSFLYDKYFKETEKVNNESLNQTYDMWGNYTSADVIATLATHASNIESYATSSDCTNRSISSPSWLSYPTPEEFQRVKERVEELGHKCEVTECETHDRVEALAIEINDELSRKVDIGEVTEVNANINKLFGAVDEIDYDLSATMGTVENMQADMRCFEEDIWEMTKRLEKLENEHMGVKIVPVDSITVKGTSSNVYPARNYNINIKADYMSGSDNGKEKENMDTNKMFNFDFGPVASHIRMSPYGLAIKSADNKFVSYDKDSGSVVDVEVFNFDAQKFLYKMPVPVSQVAVGDVVVHMRKPMFVREVKGNVVSVVDIYNAEAKDILPVKSPFGFNFITKIVSLIDMTGADANSPFGNMLPLLMMGESQDFKDILPMMFFMNGNNANMMNNPLMMYALMNNTNNVDSLGFFLALSAGMGGNNLFAPAAVEGACHHADGAEHHCCHNHN